MNFATLYNEPRIYAYSLPEVGKLAGWLKIGYTDRQTVDERIRQQLKTPRSTSRRFVAGGFLETALFIRYLKIVDSSGRDSRMWTQKRAARRGRRASGSNAA